MPMQFSFEPPTHVDEMRRLRVQAAHNWETNGAEVRLLHWQDDATCDPGEPFYSIAWLADGRRELLYCTAAGERSLGTYDNEAQAMQARALDSLKRGRPLMGWPERKC
jgi:hypothetical protein